MTYGERTARTAVFVGPDGVSERLPRIPLMTGSFNEAWLQELLEQNPSVIPSGEIGTDFAPLVCIGKEVPAGTGETKGFIDNLYITPSGKVVIVETKLFRNQESRRTVVAQIIDYAKELQQWDCEKLDAVASDYFAKTEGQASRIIDVMAKKGYLTYSDEAAFTDRVNDSLNRAAFLLLIIGDGIRSSVQQLAEFLNENTSMAFHLSLIEMEVYQMNGGVIVIPTVLTKTAILERFVVTGKELPSLNDKASPAPSQADSRYVRKPILSRTEFVKVFADNGGYDPDQVMEFIGDMELINGLSVKIAPTELTIRFTLDDGHSYPLLTFCISNGYADLYVMPGRLKAALEKYGRLPCEADDFLAFYKDYIDLSRCKTAPYEYIQGFYYAIVSDVLQHQREFIAAAEAFVTAIAEITEIEV